MRGGLILRKTRASCCLMPQSACRNGSIPLRRASRQRRRGLGENCADHHDKPAWHLIAAHLPAQALRKNTRPQSRLMLKSACWTFLALKADCAIAERAVAGRICVRKKLIDDQDVHVRSPAYLEANGTAGGLNKICRYHRLICRYRQQPVVPAGRT